MISAFGVEHGVISKSEVGGGVHNAWKLGRMTQSIRRVSNQFPRGDPERAAGEAMIGAQRRKLRTGGSAAEKVGFHAGRHAGKYALGGAAGGGVLVGRKTKQNRAVAPETKGKRR